MRQATSSLKLDVLKHLDEWRRVFGKHVSTTRQLLRKLMDGRWVFTPQREGEDAWYELVGQGSLAKFFDGIPLIKAGSSPTGHAASGCFGPFQNPQNANKSSKSAVAVIEGAIPMYIYRPRDPARTRKVA
jgi:hypothetical protein